MTPPIPQRRRWAASLVALTLLAAGCGDDDTAADATTTTTTSTVAVDSDLETTDSDAPADTTEPDDDGGDVDETSDVPTADGTLPASAYLSAYELMDEEFATMVTVTVDGETRTIETNALPDHETGEFPNAGNPNEITAQDLTWEFPVEATYTGDAIEARTVGVAVNGVKFEPGTAETLTCSSGETFRIEALQDTYDLGLDVNNAHVQPTGEYHYHGVSALLVDAYDSGDDLVHVGFAADGHLMYYSLSGAYSSGYALETEARSGTDCTPSGPAGGTSFDVEGTTPDGTYTSDYAWSADSGDLDSCNGVEIDGEYVYLITDEYPFVGRCLNGEASGAGVGGPPPGGDDGGPPPGGG